jgi:predicted SprT family Zn-dependent metalloprotease
MTAAQLERRLSRVTGRKLSVTLTNNRQRVLTYHPPGLLRISRIFLTADEEVLAALAAFIRGSRRAKHVLQAFTDRRIENLARRRARRGGIPVQPHGERYDLQSIFDRLNYRYFAGSVDAYITWGRRRALPGKRSVQLGTYSAPERLIRINPVLDQPRVPRHVVEKVVFHEMLHHVLTPRERQVRRCLHTKEFLEAEKHYSQYDAAEQWLQRNMKVVLA